MADYGNDRVQIFNSQGQFLRKFGSFGEGHGQIMSPVGVGLLSNGNIVVSEFEGHRLQIFDFQGKFVRIVGAVMMIFYASAGPVKDPQHLFVNSDDNILVYNNRIQVFHQNGDHIKAIETGQLSYPRWCLHGS